MFSLVRLVDDGSWRIIPTTSIRETRRKMTTSLPNVERMPEVVIMYTGEEQVLKNMLSQLTNRYPVALVHQVLQQDLGHSKVISIREEMGPVLPPELMEKTSNLELGAMVELQTSVLTEEPMAIRTDTESRPSTPAALDRGVGQSVAPSSGDSKYNISSDEDDPYKSPQFSEDEYRPSNNDARSTSSSDNSNQTYLLKARKNLFGTITKDAENAEFERTDSPVELSTNESSTSVVHEPSTSSTNESSTYDVNELSSGINEPSISGVNEPSTLAIQNAFFSKQSEEYVSYESILPSNVKGLKKTLAQIEIIQSTVTMQLCDKIHSGVYKTVLFETPSKYLRGYLMKEENKNHSCLLPTPGSAQIRRCGRLLITLTSMDESIKSLDDIFYPQKYRMVMNAIRIICVENKETGKLASPSLALQYGPIISHLIARLKVHNLETGLIREHEKCVALDQFAQLHDIEFSVEISRNAVKESNVNKFEARKVLPKPEDVSKLTTHMKEVSDQCFEDLRRNGFNFAKWRDLGRSILCQLMVFNRRRAGEASRMKLADYNKKIQVPEEVFPSLTRLQIITAQFYHVMYLIGKRNRILPVLIEKDQVKKLDLLIFYRDAAGVPKDNPYLFGFPNKDGHISSVVLKQFSLSCGADNPLSLTSTYLRKQVATMSQLFNLSSMETQQLVNFMGHDMNVHNLHYRLSETTSQVTKLSRFLAVVGDPDVYKFRNMTLDELGKNAPPPEFDEVDADDTEEFGEEQNLPGTTSQPTNQVFEEESRSTEEPVELFQKIVAEPSTPKMKRKIRRGTSGSQKTPTRKRKHTTSGSPRTPTKKPKQGTSGSSKTSTKHKSPISLELLRTLSDPGRRRRTVVRHRWTEKEMNLVRQVFATYLERKKLPARDLCKQVLEANPNIFEPGRSVATLYACVQNEMNRYKYQ